MMKITTETMIPTTSIMKLCYNFDIKPTFNHINKITYMASKKPAVQKRIKDPVSVFIVSCRK